MSDWNVISGHFLTRSEVAQLTGLAPAEVVSHPALLRIACQVSQVETYPAFQFDADGRPVACLAQVLPRLAGALTPLEVAALLSTPSSELGGRIPIAWLRDGGPAERVLRLIA